MLFVPLPSHVYCPLEVQARDAASVYVEQPGILEAVLVKPGDQVEKGQLLAELRNVDVDVSIAELTGQRDVYTAQLDVAAQHELRTAATPRRRSPRLRKALDSDRRATGQARARTARSCGWSRRRAARCCRRRWCRSKPGRRRNCRPGPARRLKPENLGATLMNGTKFCQIGDPQLARSPAGDRSGRRRVRRAGPAGGDHAAPSRPTTST